jgi:hypothetical protein
MALFSEEKFQQDFQVSKLEQTIGSSIRCAIQDPTTFYHFMQRYTYFNGFASAVISRLASSLAMSRYLFRDSSQPIYEESDRGFNISSEVMVAASDEESNQVTHRELAHLLLHTVGDYAKLDIATRNQISEIPTWLDEISQAVMSDYQGIPGNIESLVKALGFHAASEMLGDVEYDLLDKIVRHDHRGVGFDRFMREEVKSVQLKDHRYHPWCYVLIHSQHGGGGAEEEHFAHALNALNLVVAYRSEGPEQIKAWAYEGYQSFVDLQQDLFREIYRECLELQRIKEKNLVVSGQQSLQLLAA